MTAAGSSAPEATAALRRASEALKVLPLNNAALVELAHKSVAAALDVEEMARAADPKAFEDHPIELRSRPAALQWAVRRKIATDHARAIRDAILGGDAR